MRLLILYDSSRGERPPYWTALVQSTYDQKKALGGFSTTTYALSKFFVDFTMGNRQKVGQSASQPPVFDDTYDSFYLANSKSF